VTGGVQTFLAKYWSARLNKTIMRAFQSSRRTGYMTVELRKGKVLITGQAIVVLEGIIEE
jgi:predicted PhzF superfamily epimerase YddE/YHI9